MINVLLNIIPWRCKEENITVKPVTCLDSLTRIHQLNNGAMHLTQVTTRYSIGGYGRLPANADGI
jgi:hypothetical protein